MFDSPNVEEWDSPEQLASYCQLLEGSGVLDPAAYRAAAGIGDEVDAAEHYLREGWRRGLEPGPEFDGKFLYPYFQSVGLNGPPALSYVLLYATKDRGPTMRAQIQEIADGVLASNLFDTTYYVAQVGPIGQLDPAIHYVVIGELIGYRPSERFDPVYYRRRYNDVADEANALAHYLAHGMHEGRRSAPFSAGMVIDTSGIDPARETVLLIIHQATRTGAPILGYNVATRLKQRYNIVTLILADGELTKDFGACSAAVIEAFASAHWHPVEADFVVQRLVNSFRFHYAIANSIDSKLMLKPLTLAHVPVVALVHEFSSHVLPRGEMGRALEWATQIVFSTDLTVAAACADYPNLQNRPIHVLRQGRPDLPPREQGELDGEQQSIRDAMRGAGAGNAFVVLGCGTINIRKGVDVFLSCASAVATLRPRRPVRFIWIGDETPSPMDQVYRTFLNEQIERSGLKDAVAIVGAVADLGPAYELSDVFFLSSRLDPLPNVAIEAALRRRPVICFRDATGFAEILQSDPATRMSVVDHLDAHAAAVLIVKLADDAETCQAVGHATERAARAAFDMDDYVRGLDAIGLEATAMMRQRDADFETIDADLIFDVNMSLGLDSPSVTREEAIRFFLARSAAFGTGQRPTANFYYRRPCPGFHPQVYAYENRDSFDHAVVNPLAHFIRRGKPEGPWRPDVIFPVPDRAGVQVPDGLRIALHGHFHYPEVFGDFLRKLAANSAPCDLLLSTSDEDKARALRHLVRGYNRGAAEVRVVPNRGRDVGAFLTEFAGEIVGRYDIVGHLHGKRSLFVGEPMLGETWREFLWQNLLGGFDAMMDNIITALKQNPKLGIVFPSDPHLSDWDFNLEIATGLARRMGITGPLPPFFDFPVGTMFWARTEALRPLFDLRLGWDDYPAEPVPIDGTILHAIERLLPFVARRAGYDYAVTHVPAVTW